MKFEEFLQFGRCNWRWPSAINEIDEFLGARCFFAVPATGFINGFGSEPMFGGGTAGSVEYDFFGAESCDEEILERGAEGADTEGVSNQKHHR